MWVRCAAMDLLCRDKPPILRKLTSDNVEDGAYCVSIFAARLFDFVCVCACLYVLVFIWICA